MDRFDICSAYYWYAVQHHTGQGSKEYAIHSALDRIDYSPGLSDQHGNLTETAQMIYEDLVSNPDQIRDRR